MSKKKRLMIRIVCGLLCLVMILGCIVPYVQAAEISQDAIDQLYEAGIGIGQELESENEPEVNIEPEMPTSTLPAGFEYSYENGYWEIIKTEGFDEVGFMLDGVPDTFDQPSVTFFIGNIETKKVVPVTVNHLDGYVASVALDAGYYVLFSNDYVWSDKDGNTFSVNNNSFFYFCVGDVDNAKYSNDFYAEESIFNIKLTQSESKDDAFEYGKTLSENELKVDFPKTVVFGEEEKPVQEEEVEYEEQTLVQILVGMVKDVLFDSWWLLLIILVSGCYYSHLKNKRLRMLNEQTENDSYDDARIE